ncbi:type II secretion system protein M [Paraburkholderia agricolaris]|uniref:Type II secretion system protein M n=1 Tax=Paraburkholderia agricolaris TaxID=2152888 RepID=A0ABW9A0M3_9BURK
MDAKVVVIRHALTQWWEARATREKQLLGASALLAGVAVVYSVLWSPAFDGSARLLASLPGLEAEVADVGVQADEARGLRASGAIAAPSGTALRDALSASLDAAALGQVQLAVLDKAVQVDAKDVPFGAWIAWLDEARKRFHVRAISARVTANDKPGHAAVSVTLQPAGEQ